MKLANQNEEKLSLQGEMYLQALIAKDIAFGAFSADRQHGAPTTRWAAAPGGGTSPKRPSRWVDRSTLFNGFRDWHSLQSADATIEQQKQLVLDVQQTVLLDVVQAYYQVLTDEQSVDVLSNSLKLQQANLHEHAGAGGGGARRGRWTWRRRRRKCPRRRSRSISRGRNVRNDRAMLVFLVDAPIEQNPLRDDYDPPADISTLARLGERWRSGSPGFAGRQCRRAARRGSRWKWNSGTILSNAELRRWNMRLYSDPGPSGAWNILLGLTQPLYDAGIFHADVRNAWSLFRQAALTQIQLRRQIDQQIETAFINLQLARQQLLELQVEVRAAKDAYDNALAQYQQGSQIYLNVLTALNTLLTSQLQLTTEQFAAEDGVLQSAADGGQAEPGDGAVGHAAVGTGDPRAGHAAGGTQPSTMP